MVNGSKQIPLCQPEHTNNSIFVWHEICYSNIITEIEKVARKWVSDGVILRLDKAI